MSDVLLTRRLRAAFRAFRTHTTDISGPGDSGATTPPLDQNVGSQATPPRLIDLSKRAYDEVLDATKHQDDKVGRFLTAIAFLTTGAIALVASDQGLRRTFEVPDGGAHPLLAWSTGGFFVFTLASVALLLLCLSVPVRLPKTVDDPMKRSHLFYSYIENRPRDEWINHWMTTDVEEIEKRIAKDYAREAHNLAERTSAKYRHSYEASWFFVCALLFLSTSIFLKVIAEFEPDKDVAAVLRDGHLVGLAAIASFHAALQIYTRWVHDVRSLERARDYNNRDSPPPTTDHADSDWDPLRAFTRNVAMHRQRRCTWMLVISTTAFSLLLASPIEGVRCGYVLTLAGIALAVFVPTWMTRPIWDEKKRAPFKRGSLRAWWFPVATTIVATLVAATALHADGVWRTVAIILPPLVTGLVNLSRPAYSHRVARRLELKALSATS